MLLQVAPQFIDRAWKDGASALSEACDKSCGEVTIDQLKLMLSRGERRLVCGKDGDEFIGWAVVDFLQLPNVRVLHVFQIVAHNAATPQMFEKLKQYASENGASEIRGCVSPAIARLWRSRFGFEPVYETVRMVL